jgi:hypothetical protein
VVACAAASMSGCADDGDDDPGASVWLDRTYVLSIPATNWSKPKGIGSDVGVFVPQFAFTITGSTETQIDLVMGTALDDATQDPCNPTSTFPGTSDPFPAVQIGPRDFRARVVNDTTDDEPIIVLATIADLELIDVLPADGEPAEDGVLRGRIDTRDVFTLFTQLPEPSPETVCAAAASFEAPCAACDDGEEFCIDLEAIGLGATEAELPALLPIDESDIDASCLGE